MKRSEMLLIIATALKDQWYKENGPKLKGSSYIGYSIADGYKQAQVALKSIEDAGMLPPETHGYTGDDYDRVTQEPTPRYGLTHAWDKE